MRFDSNRPALDQLDDADKNVGMAPIPPLDQAVATVYRLATDVTGELEAKANALAALFGLGVADSLHRTIVEVAGGAMDARALLFRHRRQADEDRAGLIEALTAAVEKVAELATIIAGADAVAAEEYEPGTRDAVLELLTALENLADLGGGRSDGNRLARQALDRFAAWADTRPGKRLRVTWAPTAVTDALEDLLAARDGNGARAQALADAGITLTTIQVAIDALRMADGSDEVAAPPSRGTTWPLEDLKASLGELDRYRSSPHDRPRITDGAITVAVDALRAATAAQADEVRTVVPADLPAPTDHRLDGRAFAEGIALETIHTGELVSIVTLPGAGNAGPGVDKRAFARRARQ